MKLKDYINFYVNDEGHWYVSKIIQYNEESISKLARGLHLISDLLSRSPNKKIVSKFVNFKPAEQPSLFKFKTKQIPIDNVSKLFISIQILASDLIDSSHLSATNPKKFKIFLQIKKHFFDGEGYAYFIKKYTLEYLNRELMVYYRNFESWLSKFGFMGRWYNKDVCFITEAGQEFLISDNDKQLSSAIFLNQIKKVQVWNPTLPEKYRRYQVKPYYLLLDILLRVNEHYLSKVEYALFITKIQSHTDSEIEGKLQLIYEFRKLSNIERAAYIENINKIDRKRYPGRRRTNYEEFLDSSGKEIDAYTWGNLITEGEGDYANTIRLINISDARRILKEFNKSPKYIYFHNKFDWIRYLGNLEGLTNDDIIDMYVREGLGEKEIKDILMDVEEERIEETIEDKILEKEIEEYYEKNLSKLYPELKIVQTPEYGRQFPTQIGPIDLLCMNIKTKEYFVLEFKRGQASDETIGQILRYMGWVYINLSESNNKVRGIIIGNDFNEKLHYSFIGIQNDSIFDIVKLKEHNFTPENRPKLK